MTCRHRSRGLEQGVLGGSEQGRTGCKLATGLVLKAMPEFSADAKATGCGRPGRCTGADWASLRSLVGGTIPQTESLAGPPKPHRPATEQAQAGGQRSKDSRAGLQTDAASRPRKANWTAGARSSPCRTAGFTGAEAGNDVAGKIIEIARGRYLMPLELQQLLQIVKIFIASRSCWHQVFIYSAK